MFFARRMQCSIYTLQINCYKNDSEHQIEKVTYIAGRVNRKWRYIFNIDSLNIFYEQSKEWQIHCGYSCLMALNSVLRVRKQIRDLVFNYLFLTSYSPPQLQKKEDLSICQGRVCIQKLNKSKSNDHHYISL